MGKIQFNFTYLLIKVTLYVKIIYMKEFAINKIKKILLVTLTALFILSAVAFSFGGISFAFSSASYSANTELFLPSTELEYKGLNSPIDVYSDDSVTAIIERDDQSLSVYRNGEFTKPSLSFTDLQQVKKLDDNTLLVSDGVLYTITLDTFQKAPYMFNENGVNEPVDANYFDYNGKFLIKVYNTVVVVYKIENSLPVSKSTISGCTKAPVAINENNHIFFVKNNNLCSLDLSSSFMSEPNVLLENVVPSYMIAKGDFIYYLFEQDLYRLNVIDKTAEKLAIKENLEYQLGNVKNPISISFRNENILITDDNVNAIQEFKVDGSQLIFTGFAIAKDKTAFNRIGKTVSEIEKHGNTLAVLDENKLSIINAKKDFDSYCTDNFTDYFKKDLGENMPSDFALGSNSVLLSYIDDYSTAFGSLKLLGLNDNSITEVHGFESTTIRDITYQSGYYYALVSKGNSYKIYSASESVLPLSFTETSIPANRNSTMIAVDVFKNVYVADELNSKINKYSLTDENYSEDYAYTGKIKKITTDLGGGLFALKDSSVLYFDSNINVEEIELTPPKINDSAITKSFAMDFISNEVYIVYENEEFICKTKELGNFAISSMPIPATYITTAKSAELDNFKVYTPSENANVYSIDKTDDAFNYNNLIIDRNEYALISEITNVDVFGRELKMLALAGQDGVVLINADECNEVNIDMTDAPEKAFITTAVHCYYLPISTPNDGYALSDVNRIRLAKSTLISPQKTFTFLNATYYFASVTVDGVTYLGYIPKNFTVEILSEDFEWGHYTLETVKNTTVFEDKELTKEIHSLSNGDDIRILEQDGSVCKIAYKVEENGWAIGYIKSSAIIDESNVAIRNILIILAVVACVCGTTSYFFLRRKVN